MLNFDTNSTPYICFLIIYILLQLLMRQIWVSEVFIFNNIQVLCNLGDHLESQCTPLVQIIKGLHWSQCVGFSSIVDSSNRRFAKPRPLLKCYGNQPSAILNGASVNNHDSTVYKFGGDSSSNRAVYVNNRLELFEVTGLVFLVRVRWSSGLRKARKHWKH